MRIRLEKGLSQEELAARSGFNQHYISELEAGKRNPTAMSLYELSVGLGVPPADIMTVAEGTKLKRLRR